MIQDHTLAGGNKVGQRESNDFYRTPEWATYALIQRETFQGTIWEPACGDGAISRLLPDVISTDLFNRGFGETGVDFLKEHRKVNNIITNPPFKLAQEFAEHGLECASHKVVLLLKLNFLEGVKRYEFFNKTPLKTVYVFCRRISFDKGNEKGKGAGLLAYAWYVWDKHMPSYDKPQIDWIC